MQQDKIWILPSDTCLARPYTTKQQSETEHIIGQKIIICFLNSSHHNRTEIIISFLYSSHHNRTEIIICFRNSSHHNRTEIIICKTHHNPLHCCCDGFLEFCWLLTDMLDCCTRRRFCRPEINSNLLNKILAVTLCAL